MCGSESDALKVMSELERRFPTATLTNRVGRPVIAALLALRRGKPQEAVTILDPVRPFDYVPEGELWPLDLRGQAYLQSREPAAAATEFSDVLEHRGVAPASVLYPLAYLGLGRAAALAGNADQALRQDQGLLTLWTAADVGLAPLTVAQADYRHLVASTRSKPDGEYQDSAAQLRSGLCVQQPG